MQLSAALQRRVAAVSRPCRRNVPAPARRAAPAAAPRDRRHLLSRVAAAEEDAAGAATATEEAASDEAPNGAAAAGAPAPLERARAALEAEALDKGELEAAFADVEAELSALRAAAAAGEAEGARAAQLEGGLATSKDQYLRLQADFENFRRRTAQEKDELSSRAKGDVVVALLPLLDAFELARTQVKAETEGEVKIHTSYQGLYKQMVDIVRSIGVEPVDTVGAPFDPEVHEAIAREANDDVPDGTVLQEFRKGFKMGARMLRPAMVQVSFTDKAPEAPRQDTADDLLEEGGGSGSAAEGAGSSGEGGGAGN